MIVVAKYYVGGPIMAQTVSHTHGVFFVGEAFFVPKAVLVEYGVVKVAMGHFSPSTSVSTPVSIISTLLYTH
jgi:hypothetical protein